MPRRRHLSRRSAPSAPTRPDPRRATRLHQGQAARQIKQDTLPLHKKSGGEGGISSFCAFPNLIGVVEPWSGHQGLTIGLTIMLVFRQRILSRLRTLRKQKMGGGFIIW